MATALDVITRAMRKLRVLGIGKDPKDAEAQEGLTELNNMLAEWAIDGIDIAHLTLILSDEIDVPDDHLTAIVLCLAARLGGTYGAALSEADAGSLDHRLAILRAYHFSIATIGIDHPSARPDRSCQA